MNERIPTPTVGEILIEEFMKPLNMSIEVLASGIGLSEYETLELLSGRLSVTPEISQRLSKYLGMSEMFFYGLQQKINMRNARFGHEERTAHELALA